MNPCQPFTYCIGDVSTVVGPTKGPPALKPGSTPPQAKQHAYLMPGRPVHVGIPVLVKDAIGVIAN